jgi:hypothetical protein
VHAGHRRRLRPGWCEQVPGLKGRIEHYLHCLSIDEETIELVGSFGGSIRLEKGDRGDSTALSTLVVCDQDFLDVSCRLGEVFLFKEDGISSRILKEQSNRIV